MTGAAPRLVVSVSGGKDSTAMALHLRELGLEYDLVFMDTGWEHAETYRYVCEVLPEALGQPVVWLRADERRFDDWREEQAVELEAMMGLEYSAMVRECLHKGMFASRIIRWCTQTLKTEPIRAYLRAIEGHAINAVGIRAEESRRRAAMPEWEWVDYYDALVWRPLIDWSFQDVVDIHHRHGVMPNPLYLDRSSRVGCWPCIMARKAEIRQIADTDPVRIKVMRRLEAAVARLTADRATAQGRKPGNPPAWFQSRQPRREERHYCTACDARVEDGGSCCGLIETRTVMAGDCWPIDRVVDWSRTSRGGRQMEWFASAPEDTGCMRWGLCEHNTEEA